jgi:uncharacterized protein (TIGR03083 family)
MSQHEARAVVATLEEVAPSSPTACAGWTAHDIVAHFAAGSKETADLIEEKLAGFPPRRTKAFEDREPPYRALADDELRAAWQREVQRKTEAQRALAALGQNATFEFTGATMTAAQSATHSRSEAAVHRWDMAGDDAISDELLAQPELTRHAIWVLDAMPVLNESARARVTNGGRFPLRIVLRAADQPDVVLDADADGTARFELLPNLAAEGDAVVTTDPAHRLLTIWGRRSAERPVTIEADEPTSEVVSSVLWGAAVPWC